MQRACHDKLTMISFFIKTNILLIFVHFYDIGLSKHDYKRSCDLSIFNLDNRGNVVDVLGKYGWNYFPT